MMIAVSKNKFIVLLYLKHLDGRDEHRLEVLDITVNINRRLYIFLSFYWKQIYQWKMNQRHVHLFVLVLNALTCISYIARTLRWAVAAVKCLDVDFWKGWFNCNTMIMIMQWSWSWCEWFETHWNLNTNDGEREQTCAQTLDVAVDLSLKKKVTIIYNILWNNHL